MSEEYRKKKHRKHKSSQEMTPPSTENIDISRPINTGVNSGRERKEIIDQNLNDIIGMNQESLIDSFKSIEALFSEYSVEIVKGTYMLMDEIVIFFINLRISLWPTLKKYPITFYQSQIEKLEKCLQLTPISNSFNFTSCTVSQFWAVVIMEAKCYGEIFANTSIGYFLLSLLFGKEIPSLFFIYIVLPLFAYLLNQKTPMSKISLAERRWLILVFSFLIGALTHFILINWDLGVFPSPPLYSPTLVALLFEFLGPMMAYDRRLLLLSTIGIATCVCFTYPYIYACFTFTYFYTSLIAIASSFYGMQQHLADPKLGFINFFLFDLQYHDGHVLLPIYSMYNKLAMTVIFGSYLGNHDPNTIKPNTLEERYTLLLRRLH
uniref:Uncharacterized protein n=1 Tax=Elaeophora elaphi TaxID=1147741 RepID=A0A0R3RZP2_9BILA